MDYEAMGRQILEQDLDKVYKQIRKLEVRRNKLIGTRRSLHRLGMSSDFTELDNEMVKEITNLYDLISVLEDELGIDYVIEGDTCDI